MTAKEARKLSEPQAVRLFQVVEILEEVKKAASLGMYECSIPKDIPYTVVEVLNSLGYEFLYDGSEHVGIRW